MTTNRTIRSPDDVTSLVTFLGDMEMPYSVSVVRGEPRSPSQNNYLHMIFGEIAKQSEGETIVSVKGVCHRKFGVPIRLASDRESDRQFAWVWEQTGARLPYEKQCALLGSGILSLSSGMLKTQLRQYMDEMLRDYRSEGFVLTDPEERG